MTAAAWPKGGLVTLYVDDGKVGEGRIQATVPMIYSGDETCDLGSDTGMPVSDDHTSAGSQFTGKIKWVQLDAGTDDNTHLITPGEITPRRTTPGRHRPPVTRVDLGTGPGWDGERVVMCMFANHERLTCIIRSVDVIPVSPRSRTR